MNPEDLCYSKEHTWARIEGEETIIGVTDYAQEELGDVVFVELPAAGEIVKQGEAFGTIESVKAVSDLHAPLSGEVLRVNDLLEDAPETVNEDPYNNGWIIAIKPENLTEKDNLLNATDYQRYTEEESGE